MSTRQVDALIDAVPDADRLADAVEAHLDEHPLPVDEAEVARVVERLQARMRPARRSRAGLGVALVASIAAVALVAVRVRGPAELPVEGTPQVVVQHLSAANAPAVVRVVDMPGVHEFSLVERHVEVAPDSRLLTSERGRTAVMLVQRGRATVDDGQSVPAAHWALLTRTSDGSPHTVVFPDGQAPPSLNEPVWDGPAAHEQLRGLRWQSLPASTLSTLEQLLEEP